MSFFLERGRRFVSDKKDGLLMGLTDSAVSKALRLPDEKRRRAIPLMIKSLEMNMRSSPALAYKWHEQLGYCYQGIDQYADAISHFDHAVALHPEPNPESDFQSYVESYLRSLSTIKQMPEEDQKDAHLKAVARLTELAPILPGYEYRVRGFLGVSYQDLGKMRQALENMEQSLLTFPDPKTEGSDFPVFSQNYLNCVRLISQKAIKILNGKGRQQAVSDLVNVVNSTGRVGLQYRSSKEIHHEHHAAFGWLQKAGGGRNAIKVNLN